MLYEQSRLSLGYVIGALPIFALIDGRVEVALDDIMVYDILEEFKVDLCLGRWIWEDVRWHRQRNTSAQGDLGSS
jgi:hypothetical protein